MWHWCLGTCNCYWSFTERVEQDIQRDDRPPKSAIQFFKYTCNSQYDSVRKTCFNFAPKNYIHLISQILLISFICKEFKKNWQRNSLLHTINHNCNKKSVHSVFKSTCLESCLLTFEIERILFWKHKKNLNALAEALNMSVLHRLRRLILLSDLERQLVVCSIEALYVSLRRLFYVTPIFCHINILSESWSVPYFFFYSSESYADNRFFVEWNTSSLVLCVC